MTSALDNQSLDQIFRSARTPNGWADRPVEDDTVREIYDLMKWGPTSANCSPAQLLGVSSAGGKATLAGLAAESNKPKILKAPVTVIIGHDLDFAGELPKLLPHNAEVMQKYFAAPGVAEVTAMRNGTLQGAYLIVAARRWDWTAAPCRALTTLAWIRPFFPARESSRTLSAALATAIQLPCFRAILALVLRRPVAGPKAIGFGIGGEMSRRSAPRTPRARRTPNRKGDTDVRPIQAIRVDPVRTSRCGRHRHRRLPRRRRLDPSLLRHRGTRRTGLQLRAGRSRPLQERSGRPHADACEGAGPRKRRSRLGGPRGDAGGHATSGCPVAAPVLPRSPHRADPGPGRDGGSLQSSCLRAAEARWVLRHRRPRRRRRGGHERRPVAASD